jgi:hypothetical protein
MFLRAKIIISFPDSLGHRNTPESDNGRKENREDRGRQKPRYESEETQKKDLNIV